MDRSEIRPGVKSFHLELVERRRHSAPHLVYFKETQSADGTREVAIIGLVHENMMPKRKLSRALRDLEADETVAGAPKIIPE
jgi:hypothetical protein